ncbi:hypothetical protein Bhyg_05833, partial [Pseudolycoriella hygida]
MNNLWKKEAERTEYVNLFASVKDSGLDEMCIELFTLGKSQKDNLQSTEWLVNGNNYFCQNKWYKAMECYRKSLCFAQAGSANEALAYSNISACLLRLNWFNETLHCIELARQSNLPDRVKPTLKQRVIDCLRRMLMSPSYPVYERMHKFKPKLSYNADEDYPCMANVVEIQRNDIFGRHLVAKCDIPVGQTVLMEEDIPLIRDDNDNRSIEQRKTFLKLRWGIDCKCEKCVPIRASFDKKVTTSDLSYKYVVENHKNTNDFANVVKNCIRFLETFGRSQWSPEIEFVFNVYGQCLRMGFGN